MEIKSRATALRRQAASMTAMASIIAATSLVPAAAGEPVPQPRIVTTETYIPGYSVKCTGTICEEIMKYLDGPDMTDPNPLLGAGDGYVDHDQFCRNMRAARPPGCDADNPPSSPGYDPNWMGNGCGDGSFKVAFLEAIAGLVVPNYTGNLDHPLPGVSFFGSCQAHDQCYGMAPTKGWCDGNFNDNMKSACSTGNTTHYSQCLATANALTAAVVYGGTDAHTAAQQARQCAAWANDLKENGC